MEFLVPLMPMFATLPFAVAAGWAVQRILRHRERQQGTSAELDALREEMEGVRQAQVELQERLDVTERVLAQVRDTTRNLPGGE